MRRFVSSTPDARRQQYLSLDQPRGYWPIRPASHPLCEIHIADGVWHELNAGGRAHPGSREVDTSAWIQRHAVRNSPLVRALRRDLDAGEAETLALAVELEASLVLIDEREGRHAALRLELQPLGVLEILLRGKEKGHLSEIRPLLNALREEAGFYVSDRLLQSVLAAASE